MFDLLHRGTCIAHSLTKKLLRSGLISDSYVDFGVLGRPWPSISAGRCLLRSIPKSRVKPLCKAGCSCRRHTPENVFAGTQRRYKGFAPSCSKSSARSLLLAASTMRSRERKTRRNSSSVFTNYFAVFGTGCLGFASIRRCGRLAPSI